MAFAICGDQGSMAAFSGLRIARAYASSAGIRRALLIVVEQAALPYSCPVVGCHRSTEAGVAMLYGDCATPRAGSPMCTSIRVSSPDDAAKLAAADLAEDGGRPPTGGIGRE